jgi:hypothetical protein
MGNLRPSRGPTRRSLFLIAATAAIAACGDGGSIEPPGVATFSRVQEVLGTDCKGCHDPGRGHLFDLGMDSAEVVQSGVVNSVNPDQSLLILKPTLGVSHGGGLISGFTEEDKQLVESWIASLPPSSAQVLTALKVGTGSVVATPSVDGLYDPVWYGIPSTRYFVGGGWADARAVTLQAAYDDTHLYLMVVWGDDEASERRQPWVKQPDGTWQTPAAKTPLPGDGMEWADYIGSKRSFDEEDHTHFNYEDKLAIMWNTYGSTTVAGFDQSGCSVTCHSPAKGGQPGTTYYYSDENRAAKKYTNSPNEIADLWHWKLVRNNQHAKIDDQHVQYWVPGSGEAAEGGRASDEGTSGYGNNPASSGGYPTYRGPEPGVPPYYIFDSQKIALTDQEAILFLPGTEIPNMITSGPTGFRADIDGKAGHDPIARRWVMDIRRKLVTGDPNDVQFDDLSREYGFGVAVFDNAQIEHSYMSVVGKLAFEH